MDKGEYFLLNGAKLWISNSPFADLAIVWAKNEAGRIQGLIVETDLEGVSAPETHNKWSLRGSVTGELIFDKSKPDGNPGKLLDSSYLNSLGWEAKTNLRDGLKTSYDWFLKNLN